ncbi:hypothetical protein D3C86_2103100 [compost metagenome]
MHGLQQPEWQPVGFIEQAGAEIPGHPALHHKAVIMLQHQTDNDEGTDDGTDDRQPCK